MKKLLTTSALAAVFISGSAIAQTTVTGELRIGYKAVETIKQTHGGNAGFGSEQQINIQTKGTTNLGFGYAAGMSFETDGDQTAAFNNENVYMDFISGNTTISIGRDHIQRSDSDRSAAQLVGYAASEIAQGVVKNTAGNAGATSTTADSLNLYQASLGSAPSQNFGIAVLQNIPSFGTVSVNYVPNNAAPGVSESYNGLKSKEAYEVGFTGDFGVKGLSVIAFKNSESQRDGETTKREATNYGASYNFGSVTAAYNQKDHKGSGSLSKTADVTEKQYAVAYAVTPTLTVGYREDRASGGGTAEDAKIKSLQLGYNLGPVAFIAGVADVNNVAGGTAAEQDSRVGFVQLRGAF